ncbi:hypothetical protein FQA39_LY07143 [Lamprigera yunnana]|nr:hypothetical protein FQA39_LY07143 [Lamprigera yunnana]
MKRIGAINELSEDLNWKTSVPFEPHIYFSTSIPEDSIDIVEVHNNNVENNNDGFLFEKDVIPEEDKEICLIGRRIVDISHIFKEITQFQDVNVFNCRNEHLQILQEMRKGLKNSSIFNCPNYKMDKKRDSFKKDEKMKNAKYKMLKTNTIEKKDTSESEAKKIFQKKKEE